jgi:hypothetical protein
VVQALPLPQVLAGPLISSAVVGFFAVAFWLLALSQALLVLLSIPLEEWSWVFLLRLAAFTLIIAAVVAKNRRRD